MRYYLIDEVRFGLADLAARDTLAALLFRLENAEEPEHIEAVTLEAIEWFQAHPGFDELRRAFGTLVSRVASPLEDRTLRERVTEDLLEMSPVIVNRTTEWKKRWTAEGRREGQAVTLTRQLARRFGPLPDPIAQRIAQADSKTLDDWSLRLLDAGSLQEVLEA